MTYQDLIDEITNKASYRRYDTAVGRAFFRAVGIYVIEPRFLNSVVIYDQYKDAEALMAQRYGIAY